jgi:chromosome segregation ATPase
MMTALLNNATFMNNRVTDLRNEVDNLKNNLTKAEIELYEYKTENRKLMNQLAITNFISVMLSMIILCGLVFFVGY